MKLGIIGNLPTPDALDTDGLDIPAADLEELLKVDIDGWLEELPSIKEHYASFGEKLPKQLQEELAALEQRLNAAK